MVVEARLHDGRVLRFPDGTDPAVVQRTVKRTLGAPEGQQIYDEQAGPPKPLFGTTVGTLAQEPSGGYVLTPDTNNEPTFGGAVGRGVAGGMRDLAVGVTRAPFDVGPALGAVVPGLAGELFGVPADENPFVQTMAAMQPGAESIAKGISQTIPEIQQNTVTGDIVQGVTPFATAAALTGGGGPIVSTAGGALADFLATDPDKASTLGDVIGGPTDILPQDTALTKRAKVAAEGPVAEGVVRAGTKVVDAVKTGVIDPLLRKTPLAKNVPTTAQKELAELVRRDMPKVEQNMAAVEDANRVAREAGAIPQDSKGMQPTVAELTGDDLLLSRQREAIAANELEGQLLDRVRQNAQIMENAPRAVAAQQGTPTITPDVLGAQIRSAAQPETQQIMEQINAPATAAQQQVDDILAAVQTKGRDVGDVGRTTREDLVRAEDERLRAAASQKFQGMEDVRTDQLPNLSSEMSAQKEELKGVLTPAAVKAPMREASAAAKEIEARTTGKEVDTGLVDAQGNPITRQEPPEGASAADLQNTRSALGSKAYEAKQAGRPDEARRYGRMAAAADADLDEMEQVLEDAAIASGDENVVAQIREGRALTKERKTLAGEKTKGGDVLKTRNTSGDYALADKQVLKKLFTGNKDEVNRYLDVLDRPEYGDVKEAVKEGLAKLYSDNYTTGGKANPAKHKAFLAEYGQAGQRVWGSDWSKVSRIGDMAQQADKLTKDAEIATKNFFEGMRLQDGSATLERELAALAGEGPRALDPVKLYNTVSKLPDTTERRRFTEQIKRSTQYKKPAIWNEYKAMRAEDWIDNITDQASDTQKKLGAAKGDRVISPVKFADALSEKTPEQRETVAELRLLFGDDFVKNMKTLQEASRVFDRTFPATNRLETDPDTVKLTKKAGKIGKMIVGYFGPAGRTLTQIENMTIAQQRKAAAVMLEDPKFILEIAKAMRDPRAVAKQRRLVQMITARGILAAGDDEEPTKSEMEQPVK